MDFMTKGSSKNYTDEQISKVQQGEVSDARVNEALEKNTDFQNVKKDVNELNQTIVKTSKKLDSVVDISPNVFKYGGEGLMSKGTITNPSISYWHSDKINVDGANLIRFTKRVDWMAQGDTISLYDKNEVYLNSIPSNMVDNTHDAFSEVVFADFEKDGKKTKKAEIMYVVISFSKYDSVTTSDKDMVVVDADYPNIYVGPNKMVLAEKLELSNNQKKDIKDIAKKTNLGDIGFVMITFDSFDFDDNRFNVVNDEFGFKATVNLGTQYPTQYNADKANNYTRLYENGWDCALYSGTFFPVDIYGDDALANEPSEEIQNAWDNYVAIAIDDATKNGFYNPLTWFARQNKYCVGLENAVKKYGVRVGRGSNNPNIAIPIVYNDTFSPFVGTNGLYPNTLVDCKNVIDNAVNNKVGISLLTHKMYATEDEANANYGCTENSLREIMNYIKGYVDNGKLKVITFREMYSMYNSVDCNTLDYNRMMKRINHVSDVH